MSFVIEASNEKISKLYKVHQFNSAMSVEPIPPKDNYVAYPKNAASVADASTKIKVGGAIFGLLLATAGIGGGIYCGVEGCRANATTIKGNSSEATTTTLTPTTTQATSTTTAGIEYKKVLINIVILSFC